MGKGVARAFHIEAEYDTHNRGGAKDSQHVLRAFKYVHTLTKMYHDK